jgi:hypothetical protein
MRLRVGRLDHRCFVVALPALSNGFPAHTVPLAGEPSLGVGQSLQSVRQSGTPVRNRVLLVGQREELGDDLAEVIPRAPRNGCARQLLITRTHGPPLVCGSDAMVRGRFLK